MMFLFIFPENRSFQGGTLIVVLFVKCSVVFHLQIFFFLLAIDIFS